MRQSYFCLSFSTRVHLIAYRHNMQTFQWFHLLLFITSQIALLLKFLLMVTVSLPLPVCGNHQELGSSDKVVY